MSHIASTFGLRPIVVGQPQEVIAKREDLSLSLVLFNVPDSTIDPRLLKALSKEGTPVLVLADRSASSGKANFKNGGNGKIHVLARPVRNDELRAAVCTLLGSHGTGAWHRGAATRAQVGERYLAECAPLFLHSQRMQAIKEMIEQVAETTATVLIRGESGVGKDLVARAIHFASPRHLQPFVKVNCAALPLDLLESELFGHEKGAFTGAYQRKPGKFESASKGTLFLDEIGELPLALQAKLLNVLQDHEFSRLGGRGMIRADVRVIASTNRNLELALSNGLFREDLYYRLNVVEVHVPPLRERKEEIPILANFFLQKFSQRSDRKVELQPETMTAFMEYSWPGNIRELENTILRLVVLGNTPQILAEILTRLQALPPKQVDPKAAQETLQPPFTPEMPLGLREIARRAALDAERKAIREVLDRVHWNRSEAARLLKVSYKTLLNKINECGLAPKQTRRPA
jgi:DNA-binding NtrC family response regulator